MPPSSCCVSLSRQVLSLAGLPPPEGVTLLGPSLCLPAQVPGWLITQAQTEGVHRGLHHYPSGTDRARGRGSGWAQGTTPKGGLGSESRGIGSMCGWGARSQRQHDSGLPGSLPGVLTGPHPAVSRAPRPASGQQRLAGLAEGSVLGSPPALPSPNCHVPIAKLYYISIYIFI